jgi:hypothetical protein
MVDRLKAIEALYTNAVSIEEIDTTDQYVVKDENGNEITIDYTQVDAWVDPKLYSYTREREYKSIKEQLDMMYHDQVNGTTTWRDHINTVKTNNPKPSDE